MQPQPLAPTTNETALIVAITGPRQTPAELHAAREALSELHGLYARRLLAYLARRAPRTDVEDLHQTVWQKVWEQAPRSFDGLQFAPWLFRIAHNAAIDLTKKKKISLVDTLDAETDKQVTNPLELLLDEERRATLKHCLERLTPRASELVRGRLAGEDYPSLCQRLGIDIQAAYRTWHAAVKQLHDCVMEAGV